MKVEDVGFFRELPHGEAHGPNLRDAIGKGDAEFRDRLADYLASGSVFAATGQQVADILSEGRTVVGQLTIQTDGRWMWPSDLSYYVRTYNVELPRRFVEWARSHEWSAPNLSRDELIDIERQLYPKEDAHL